MEEGGDDIKSGWSLWTHVVGALFSISFLHGYILSSGLGYTCATMAITRGSKARKAERIHKDCNCSLQIGNVKMVFPE